MFTAPPSECPDYSITTVLKYHEGLWGTVQDSGSWTALDATAACKEYGFTHGMQTELKLEHILLLIFLLVHAVK